MFQRSTARVDACFTTPFTSPPPPESVDSSWCLQCARGFAWLLFTSFIRTNCKRQKDPCLHTSITTDEPMYSERNISQALIENIRIQTSHHIRLFSDHFTFGSSIFLGHAPSKPPDQHWADGSESVCTWYWWTPRCQGKTEVQQNCKSLRRSLSPGYR